MNHTWWTRDYSAGDVRHAELDATRIALELILGDRRYAVVLAPAPENPATWKGSWTRPGWPGTGAITARLYRAAAAGFKLIGDWNEDATTYRWVAEFRPAR